MKNKYVSLTLIITLFGLTFPTSTKKDIILNTYIHEYNNNALKLAQFIMKKSIPTIDSSEVLACKEFTKTLIPISEKPKLIWSSYIQPNPLVYPPVLFYSPHQDDETLGMGASIAEQVRKGNPVYVILLSDGTNPDKALKRSMTPNQYIQERNLEFVDACKKLGAHRIYISNNGNGYFDLSDIPTLTMHF